MFFLLPIGVDHRTRRYPVVTFVLMGICVLVYLGTFLARVTGGESGEEWVVENLWLIPGESHWWAYVTTLFVHAGFFHLLGNMVYLFLFGACVEDIVGRWRFLAFYFLGGMAASLTHIAFAPDHFSSDIPLGGATGANSACMGGFLMLKARTSIDFKWIVFLFVRIFSGEFSMPSWLVITFWFLKDVAGMVGNLGSGGHSGVAFAAHVGGTLLGIAWIALARLRTGFGQDADDDAVAAYVPARVSVRRVAPVVADPNEIATIFLHREGVQTGPFTPTRIGEMFGEGAMAAGTLYWFDGMSEWRDVEELRSPDAV